MRKKNEKSLPHGIGAVSQVMMRYLHPSKLVREKYTNYSLSATIAGLIELRQETKTVYGRQQECFCFHHHDFPNLELHAVTRWVKVIKVPPNPFPNNDPPPLNVPGPMQTVQLLGDDTNDSH